MFVFKAAISLAILDNSSITLINISKVDLLLSSFSISSSSMTLRINILFSSVILALKLRLNFL